MEVPADVTMTSLPGVGVRYEFTTKGGLQLGLVHHRSGRRELVIYDRRDPDRASTVIDLDVREARVLGELLGVSKVSEELERLKTSIEGLAIDWLPVLDKTPFAGKTVGDTAARTRTGVSIVAVLRGEVAFPSPGPDFSIESGDTLVVVGTPRGIESLAVILRTG